MDEWKGWRIDVFDGEMVDDLFEGSNKFSESLYFHSLGRDKEAVERIKEACQCYNRALDKVKGDEKLKQVSEFLRRSLAVYDGLKAGKQILNLPTKLVYISSNMGKYTILPWNSDPCDEEFSGDDFTDSDGQLAIGHDQQRLFTSWRRAVEALGGEPLMSNEGAEHLYQDRLQDCSVVASLLSIVHWERRTGKRIVANRLYPTTGEVPVVAPNGRYMVKLFVNGTDRKVVIDDYLPFSQTGERLFVSSSSSSFPVLWPALMEKAYMKVMGGYDFTGSHAARDTFAFTGWIPEYIYLKGHLEVYNDSRDKLWDRLYCGWKQGHLLVCVGTGNLSREESRAIDLVPNHDYTVIDMKVTETGQRILLVNNPWRDNDEREEVSPIKEYPHATLERKDVGDGTFWIDYNSVCLWFQSIYLNWNPDLFPHRENTHFLWSRDAFKTSQNAKTLLACPQYTIINDHDSECLVRLLLSKHCSDRDDHVGFISMTLYESTVRVLTPDEKPLFVRGPSMNTSYHTLRFSMPPKTTYVIVVTATDLVPETPSSLRFTLSVYSALPIQLAKAEDELKHKTSLKGEWTQTSAGGSWSHSTYGINPQFKLVLPRPTGQLKLLLTSETNHPINIQLFWSKGKQVRGYSQKSVLCTSGKYRVSNCVANCRTLDEGEYTAVVSMFDQNAYGPFELHAFGSSPVELQPIVPETAGLFSRSLQHGWEGTNRVEISITVKHDCMAQMHLQTITTTPGVEPSIQGMRRPSSYRPHLRISVFDGPNLVSSAGFSDAIHGVFLDRVKLRANRRYSAVVERMEAGFGSFRLFFYSPTPVEFEQTPIS